MMEEKDKLRSFYDNVSSYLDIGSYDDFYGAMQDPSRRQKFFDSTSQYVDIGDSDKFNQFVGEYFGQQQPAPRVDVSDVEAQQQPNIPTVTMEQVDNEPQQPYGDLTAENFVTMQQRGKELADQRKRIQRELDNDTEMEPLTASQRKEYENQLRGLDEEMRGVSSWIDKWNKTEGARAYYEQQKRAVDDVSARIDQMQADRNRERITKSVEEDNKKSWWRRMAEGLASAENPITEEVVEAITDTNNNDLRAARNEVRNAKNQLSLEEIRQNGEQRGLGFLRGMENANYYELMPAVGMADAMSILQLSKDIKDGKELTDSQKLLKEAMEARAGVDFAYQDNNTLWERIGQSAPEQLMFTAQFVVGAGLTGATNVGEKVAAKSAERAVKRLAKKEATSAARNFVGTRVVPELEGMAVSSAIQTFANPLSVAVMVEDFEKRYAGDIYYDKQGNLHVFDNDRSAGQAAYQAIASAWIENFTEYAGGNITKSAKLLDSKMFDLAGKFDNVMKTVGAGKIQDVFRIPQQLGRLTQIGSAPEEFLEEELGSVMNALMMTDAQRGESYGDAFKNSVSSAFAGEQQLETFLSCAITSMLLGGGGNAVNGVRNAGLRKSVNQDVEQSKALLGKVRGVDIEGLDNMIENGRVSDISAYLKEQSDANNWNKDEQGAAVSYVLNRSRQIGVKHNDDTAIEAEQAEYRRQAEDMVNRWDGQNIYNVTYTDRNGETQEGTIVNGRVHYNNNEDGTYTFDPYMSSGMLAIRRADGSVEQVAGRNVTALNNVATIEEQLESQNQTIDQLMRAEFDQDGMLPTIESVWGGNLVPNVTQFQNGRYTYLGQDDNGLYAFANNDKKTSKDNPIVYLTERQLVEYGLSLNLENAQVNGDTEAAQKAQEDIDFLKRLDEITADAGAKGQWDVVKAYAQKNVQLDANGDIIPDGSNEQATAAYLLAISEGSFENAIASVDQTIAALGTPQQTEVTDNAADNAAMNNAAATVDADKARQIDFYTNVRNRLTEMQQGKEEADQEEAEQVVANTPVSQMEVGQQFPVEWRGQQAMATVMGKDADGRSVVTVRDMDGEDIEAGIDDMSDAQWEAVRVQPQEATAPEQVPPQAPEQVEPQQEVPQAAPQSEPQPQQQEAQQQHPLDEFIAKHGDNAENKLGVTIGAINKEITGLEKDLDKAEKDLANMPEPYDEKTQKAQDKQEEKIAKLRTELDEKRNILAPYAAMQEELDRRKEVRQGRENGVTDALVKFTERLNNMLHPKRESQESENDFRNIYEFIARKMSRKGIGRTSVKTYNKKTGKTTNGWRYVRPVDSFDIDSFKAETGWKDSEIDGFKDPIQPFFVKEGGKTFGEFVHSVWESAKEEGIIPENSSDADVRDAVIAFLQEVQSVKDINDYIEKHRRDEQAEQEAIANDMIAQHNGYESGEAMENDLIAQASARADELLGSDTLSDEDVAAFDAELNQRLDNLVPSVEETTEETEPATQETTVENTEDEDFIQPTDEEAPFSVTGKSNEQIASEYQKRLDEAKTEADRAAVIQEYLDTIGTEEAVVMTSDNYESLLLLNGVKTRDILKIRDGFEYCKANNLKFNAFKVGNKVYMFAEDQDSIEDARTNYVHERQHILTTGTKKGLSLLNRIMGLASKEELEGYVERLSGSDFYTRMYGESQDAQRIYADEFISMAMERAYNGADLDAELGGLGISEDLINEIKSLDNEQRTDESLAAARRYSPVGESRQGDNGQDGGNQVSRPEEVGGQRPRSTGRSRETAERRESVTGEVDNGQQNGDGLSEARRGGGRNLHVDNNAERGSEHDGQNHGRRPGEVEEQGLRPSYRGNKKTGSGEVSGILPIDKQTPKNTTIDEVLYSIKVNHNSPYLLKKADGSFVDPKTGEKLGFDHRFMSNGEGNQAHGYGSYFSVNDLRTYGGQLGGNNVKYKGKDYYDSGLQPIALVELQLNDGNVEAARKELESRIEEAENLGEPYVGTWMLDNVPIKNAKIALEQLSNPKDFEFDRHHYEVEIPDNDGTNYIEERQKPSIEDLQRVVNVMSEDEKSSIEPAVAFDKDGDGVEVNTINDLVGTLNYYVENGGLKDLYEVALFIENDGYRSDPKEASRLLRDAGFTGIHYDGMRDGECYVIFDENDAKIVDHVRFSVREKNNSEPIYSVTSQSSEEEKEETYFNGEPRFSVVADRSLLLELERSPKVKVYRAMQMRDGNLYPPMAGKVNGEWQNPIELGVWEQADEHPELVDKNGKFKLNKGNGKTIKAAYNPYLHTSRSPLNDQFSSAWDRPELVTVEVEVPESELTSGYKAEKAKDAVGEVEWKSGPVSGKLAKKGNPRKVILSRYDKPIRIVPAEEVAERIAEMLEGTGLSIPFNTVTPELRDALVAQGVQIGKPQKGNAGNSSMDSYNEWKEAEDLRFSTNGTHVISNGKSLVGIHNIGAEKLRKAMKNGGFANPSAAVIDIDKQEHKGYGEVSLIMPSSLVDSRTGRNAGTYAGDAYTPEYPSVSYREGKNTDKLVKDLVKDLPKELGWAIQQGIGEYMDGNRSRSGLEYLFLKERGQEMPIVKNERRYPDISTEQIDKRLGVEESANRGNSGELYAAYEKLEGDDLVDFNMWFEAYGDEEKIKQRRDLMEKNAKVKEMLTEQFGEHMGYGKFDTTWYNVLRDERDAGNENIPRTLEDAAMKIDELGLRNEFEDWKQKTIDGLGYEEVIFDGYTPSGYRRYVPNTVENASRIMNKKDKTNWLSDAGTHATKAMLLDKFNTLNDIRKNRGLLESDQEVINQAYEEASDAWSELGSELSEMQKIDDNRFINHDIALNRLQEAMMQRNPAAYLNKEYKYNLDEEFNDRIKEVKQQIKSLPSKYFETKFRRPVYLNEFAAAVVPNDLPQDLKERLQQSGLPMFEYDPNKEGDRRAVTLEATEGDGIRFSVANRNQAIFVSNAARAVEGIKQEKATPEQWLKMVEKNGGLKAGEDKWLGLSQWLKESKAKTLTKQEVLDFINENAIKIEETHYGGNVFDKIEKTYPSWYKAFYQDTSNYYGEGADIDWGIENLEEAVKLYNENNSPILEIEIGENGDITEDEYDVILDWAKEAAAEIETNPINDTRLSYTTEGLDNKREIALTVPTIEPWNENDEIHFGDAGEGRAVAWIRFGDTTTEREYTEQEKADRLEQMPKADQWERVDKKDTGFANPKWNAYYAPGTRGKAGNNYIIEGDDGVFEISGSGQIRTSTLLNTRFYSLEDAVNALNRALANARGTKEIQRVLVIDEIQSKRHQEGREKGYEHYLPISGVHAGEYVKVKDEKYADRISFAEVTDDRDIPIGQIEKIDGKYRPIASNGQQIGFKDFDTEQEALDAVAKDYTRVDGIPAAPFEKNWMELAMKRMLRLAAEEGYDKVAWTTGEQQAERYNLGKFYDTIGREDKDDNYRRYVLSGNNVDEIVIDEQNRVVESSVSEAEGKPLSEVVGMDMAVKMENMNDGDELSGNELRIGGEGMKGFYDKMIPSFMNKYGKQWGVKVGEVTMPNLEEGYQTMHSIDVNEQMKADVMEGQVMFSVKNSEKNADDNQLSLFLQNNTGEYETQDGQTIGFTSLLGAATEADAVRGRDNVQRGDDILSYHLRRLEPGETCHVERRYQKSKMFDFTGSEKIESADDVAYIFNKLEDAAVENSFIVLVKDGKPTIIHTGVGSYGSTYVSVANALVAYKNINPDEVWFVHNHPSGSITSSQPDRDSSKRFEKVFGKKYKGGIIIDTTSGKYGVFDSKSDTGSGSTRNTPSNETDIDVYEFSKQVFDKDWNPETAFVGKSHKDIATFVSSHRLGEHDKMSLLVLNNNLNVVGNVFLPYESIGEADIKKLTDDVLYYTNQMAGTQAVIYGSFTADDVRDIKKLANNIANAEGRLVDVISTNSDYTGLRSVRMMGAIKEEAQEIKEDEARFSVNGQQRRAVADEFNRRTGANMEDVGTHTRIKESLIRDWFDGLHPLEQAQKLIEEKLGRKLRDSEKAYELATQTTSVSAAMIEEEEKKHIIPILNKATELIRKMMNNDRLSREEAYRRLSNYMLAKHGLERNKWFHEQALLTDPNAEEEDKSGLTGLAALLGENPDEYKAVAERIVKEFEDEYDSQEIDDYWNEMRGLTNRLLEISYESGMIDKDTYDNLKKRHKFYVPLRGFGEGTIGDIFDYIGQMPHFQDVLKKAKGRKSVAGDPLANLYNMLQSAIVIGNQNKVMQKLYNLAVNSNNDLLRLKKTWYVYDDVEDRWEERYPDIPKDATDAEIDAIVKKFDADMQAAKANGKAKTKLNKLDLAKKVLPYQAKQHEMVAYIDGKKVILQVVGNPVLAQALNKANQQQLGIFAETMQGITRFMSMINTSLSPAFMLTNSARDIGFALFSAMVTGGFKKTGQMAAWMATSGWVIPRLMTTGKLDAGLVKALGKQNAAQIEQWWNEFTQNGGETGFTRTLSAEKARGQIDDMIRHMLNGSKDGESRLRKSTVGLVESAGRWSEDISRFAAYCWSRAQGNSVMESVNEAKNVTVNFNVKGGGRLAASCRAVYSFFNAALQGIGRMARLAKENPKAFAACLTACMLQGAVLPWLNMLMFGLLGGDDDDWKKYEMLTEYTANKNLVLYVGNHKFLKIPYSQELAPFAAMGNIFFRQQMGWNKGESVASQVGKMFLDLAPVSIGESKTFMGKAIKTATPTALMPFVELWMNEDFTGSPIQKDNQWNKYARGWERAYEGKTSKWLVDASKWLDDKTGIDISPAVAEHMFSGVLGGIGRSGDKLLRYFSNGFQLQDAPFIRTMMFDSKQQGYVGAVQREYGRNAYDVLDKVKHDVENMDAMEFARFSQTEEFEIANLVSIYKTGKDLAGNKRDVMGIDKMEKEYKKLAGMSDGSEAYREQLEAVRADITELKMEMLDEIQQIKYEHSEEVTLDNLFGLRKRIINYVNEVERESKEKAEKKKTNNNQ